MASSSRNRSFVSSLGRIIFSRVFLISLLLLIQVVIFWLLLSSVFDHSLTFYTLGIVFSLLTVVTLVSNRDNPAYKLSWTMFILTLSPMGAIIYWIFGWQKIPTKKSRRLERIVQQADQFISENKQAKAKLEAINSAAAQESSYLQNYAHAPVYQKTNSKYFPLGENYFAELKKQLKTAEKFIFLEYFIINYSSQMWQEILEILCERAAQGVEIRVMYDDFGSLLTVPGNFAKKMNQLGIKTVAFNRFRPFLEVRMNNRDHRKIAVIDGKVGFTGGINFADEYINKIELHGHWKDTGVMLEGEGVWSFTLMFLKMWRFATGESSGTWEKYRYQASPQLAAFAQDDNLGFVQPFGDSPHDNETAGRNAYLNLINKASQEVIITTPYLIIDNEINTALCQAAKNGVTVKIIVPGIADKWYSKFTSQAFYAQLIEAGVEIWEYVPGFIHSKTILVDKQLGIVGTINLDYRSLYLNFEAGVWMYQTPALEELRSDLKQTLRVCRQIYLNQVRDAHLVTHLLRGVLRVFATAM